MTTAKRAVRSGVVWGVLFGALAFNDAVSYHTNFPTIASREQFAQTFGQNAAFAALIGPARRLDTVGGYIAWRVLALFVLVGAIWGLLTATRLLRGEEDAGRWELLLTGRTTRRNATLQAIAGLAAGWIGLWALTAALTVAAGSRPSVGFSIPASMFYATAASASAAMFLAIGALTSQLAPTRRQANGLAAAIYALSYVIRMVADSVDGAGWMRWASPLGWIENLHPLTGAQPLALAAIAVLVVAASGVAVTLAGQRDVGAAALGRYGPGRSRTRWLGGPALLVVRLERWVAVAWVGGLAVLALIFGLTARAAAQGNVGEKAVEQQVNRLGGHQGGVATFVGYEFLYLAALVAFAAATQISAIRSEEDDGHLDNLLARRVGRANWLAGRLGFAVALVVAAGLASGISGWFGIAGRGGIGVVDMLQAGVNIAVPALFVLGVGTLLYGLVPRLAIPVLYALVLWTFLIEIVGTSITGNHWLLDTALLSHLGPVPAATLDWTAIAWLAGLGALAAATGLAAFNRRDLAAA